MTHECDDCGREFDTLTHLRLHDCSPSDSSEGATETAEVDRLDELLDSIKGGEVDKLQQAMETYESALASAHETGASERYREISREYRKPLITALDDAAQTEGWSFLEDFIEAYHPGTAIDFPHVTTILQNVASRYLIRTRLADGIDAVPVAVLNYFDSILSEVEEGYDFINEGLHPYGWGIGHPDHSVSDCIHAHAAEDIFVVNPMLEHAFYADQHAAIEVLERIISDDSIQRTMQHPTGEISEARYLLDAPAGAVSDFWPTMPRYWDWHEELEYTFELDGEVEQRLRNLVVEEGFDTDLSDDWGVGDLTI